MDKVPPKQKKQRNATREELLELDKNDLVDRIIQLGAHNAQLKNIINKKLSDEEISENKKKKPFDFSNCRYRRVLLRILYFGWDYQGLAVQEDTTQTIEHHLFHALKKSCLIESRETSGYHRCGRTDKGVSAFGQVISISLRSNDPDDEFASKEMPYCKILNRLLPKDIKAVAWMPIPKDMPEYSARFDCKKRQYKYYFPRSSLDLASMRAACSLLIGSRDFRHLCKMDVGNGVTQFIREVVRAEILPVHEESENHTWFFGLSAYAMLCTIESTESWPTMEPFHTYAMYYLLIEGNAFLWHQIRCIMGVLLLVGEGRETADVINELLDVEKHPRKPQYSIALDLPLNLFHCSYDLEQTNKWIFDKDELKTVIIQLQGEWTIHNVKSTMIQDSLRHLEQEYESLCANETDTSNSDAIERDRITSHADCLLQGVKPKVYKPLLKRDTCSSLEERIEYYKKKRKLQPNDEEKTEA